MSFFIPLSTTPVFYQGKPQVGAQITVYDAGTLTPRTVYADGLLHAALQQPVLSDGNGCIPPMWSQGNPYRVRVLAPTALGSTLIRDIDNLPGDTSVASPPPPPTTSKPLATGDLVWNYGTAIISGRVRANGKTIGSATSGATELADPSTQALYTWLWNGDPNLAVIGGRGLSANADWTANKPITLPDFNGRTPFGLDGMGAPVTGRLNGGLFATGNPSTLGSVGGEALHVTVTGEMPSHQHTGTTQSAGAHQHIGTTDPSTLIDRYGSVLTDSAGAHSHGGATGSTAPAASGSGTTDTQGTHSHGGATTADSPPHTHNYASYSSAETVNPGATVNVPQGIATSASGGPNQNHTHGINPDGAHAHNLSMTITVAGHLHSIASDGAHQHLYHDTTQPHTHTFTTGSAGAHVHTFTSDSTGGGAGHNTLPPFLLVTFYLIL